MNNKKVALIILDGLGLSDEDHGNAVKHAHMPTFDHLWDTYPHSQLITKGLAVGLPEAQMGNSEVGHLNIGAGRVVYQSLTRINRSIQDGDFFENPALLRAMQGAQSSHSGLHLVGMVSHGGVHSDIKHLYALLKMAKHQNLGRVYIHILLDGRDTAPQVALNDIQELQAFIESKHIGVIATIAGRFYGMDRDKNWARTQKFYDAMVSGKGKYALSGLQAIQEAYQDGKTDEFIEPYVIVDSENQPKGLVQDKDHVIIFNFRPDRARQISLALGNSYFQEFSRPPYEIYLTTMTLYHMDFPFPVAFYPENISETLGEVLAQHNIVQLRAAETEKYAHVTFFFNAMREEPFKGEKRILIPSLKVETYDLAPQMSAHELTNAVIHSVQTEGIQFLLLNYANPDMVGHSGKFGAVVKALETVDQCLERLIPALQKEKFDILITADHGNAEIMFLDDGTPCKSHTFSPVPFIFIPSVDKFTSEIHVQNGILADLAPTVLYLFGFEIPKVMTGISLIRGA